MRSIRGKFGRINEDNRHIYVVVVGVLYAGPKRPVSVMSKCRLEFHHVFLVLGCAGCDQRPPLHSALGLQVSLHAGITHKTVGKYCINRETKSKVKQNYYTLRRHSRNQLSNSPKANVIK